MNELEIRVNAMATEYGEIIRAVSARAAELAAANAALRAKIAELEKKQPKKERRNVQSTSPK